MLRVLIPCCAFYPVFMSLFCGTFTVWFSLTAHIIPISKQAAVYKLCKNWQHAHCQARDNKIKGQEVGGNQTSRMNIYIDMYSLGFNNI